MRNRPTPIVVAASLGAATALLLVVSCSRRPPPEPHVADPSSTRTLAQGAVVGYAGTADDHAWRGIPYAKAPVAELRWRAPRPPAPWDGTLEALEQPPACPQFALPGGEAERGAPVGDEDCLYLNVFAKRATPEAVPKGEALRPVMLWIHGGGNTIGDTRLYNGGPLASRHDVVVVTVQYRLGAFGWFTHPSLRLEGLDPKDLSGNWGTLDLVRALDWTRENIAAFGGDPNNITVFGESAGGTDVYSLLVSPVARGRFQRAIVQSGGLWTSPLAAAENLHDASDPGDEFSSSEIILRLLMKDGAVDRAAAKVRLAGMSDAEVASYLRGKSTYEVLGCYDGGRMAMYDIPKLIRDGHVLPKEEPREIFAKAGGTADVPTIVGTNRDETKLFQMFGSPEVVRVFGIPVWMRDQAAYDLAAEYGSDSWKARSVDEPADAMQRVRRTPVFAYRFDWDEEPQVLFVDFSKVLGAAHALEIPFVFGTLDLDWGNRFLWREDGIADRDALSDAMMSYWAQFAYTGDPGRGRPGDALPAWTPWDVSSPEAPKMLVLDTKSTSGIRMSNETVTTPSLLARLENDERFESEKQRCGIYLDLTRFASVISEEEYAEHCPDFAMDEYPWD